MSRLFFPIEQISCKRAVLPAEVRIVTGVHTAWFWFPWGMLSWAPAMEGVRRLRQPGLRAGEPASLVGLGDSSEQSGFPFSYLVDSWA